MFWSKKSGIEVLIKKAKKGDGEAQWKVACAYDSGEGVQRDREKAKEWARKAYESGITSAGLWLESLEADEMEDELW